MIIVSANSTNLNAYNPWPGLAAYDEASSAFFFGRQDEAEELLRLIRLAPLTVVYGKSGLGKTSLLQAGLYPKLREQHYLPIHVRLEFSDVVKDPPLQQVMRRLREELDKEKAEYPEPRNAGSLWEYLHRKDLKIWSHDNFPLTPVLVFDQFEELFTHRSSDVELVRKVMYSLADLIENRFPPEVINEESGPARSSLDLLSQRYRMVLSFREDFLPEVQAWEQKVPSLLKNYVRLNPMSRQCAIEAVALAGKEVLKADVAPSIVDLVGNRDHNVAGMAEMAVEPVLLSLCCSRLNTRRASDEKIDRELVEHTGQDILDGFYREALDDDAVKGPPDVALFIENYLIQGDHFRGNFPKQEALDKNLLTDKQLAALTDKHRLLRIVPHPDTTRVELIHDRLVPVVRKARDERKIKQHQEEQERLAKEAQANAARAQHAEVAQQHAEELLGFLLGEQFLGEIRDVGRSPMLEQVRRKVQPYEDNRDQRKALLRGIALRNAGDIARMHGNTEKSVVYFGQALEAIISSSKDPNRDREAARTHERLGNAKADQGYVIEALAHHEAAVQAWHRVTDGNMVATADFTSFADSLLSTGEMKARLGKASLAIRDVDTAIKIITTVPLRLSRPMITTVASYPDAEALKILSRALIVRATIFSSGVDIEVGMRLANEAKRLMPASASIATHYATALVYLANSRSFEPHDALQNYYLVLAEFDLLRHRDPRNRLWEREYAAVQLLIAEGIVACHQRKKRDREPTHTLEEAELTNLKALATLKALAKIDSSNQSLQRDLGWALAGRARMLETRRQHQERLAALHESELFYSRSIVDRSDAEGVTDFGRALLNRSKALADLKRWAEAIETLQTSITMLDMYERDIETQEVNFGILAHLMDARKEERKLFRKIRNKQCADLANRELVQLKQRSSNSDHLSENNKQAAERLEASHTFVSRGAELVKENKHTAALREFKNAESVLREYIDCKPADYNGYDKLRNVYDWIRLAQDILGNTKEAAAVGSVIVSMARFASLLRPEFVAPLVDDELRQAQQAQGIALYNSKDFREQIDETLLAVQQQIVITEAILQNDWNDANGLKNLGEAYFGQGLVRRSADKAGWEEAIRIGIIYLQKASKIDRTNHQYSNDLGGMHKYLADQLDIDGLKEKSLMEYRLALEAYKKAARISPCDETALKGISDLTELGVR